MKVVHVLFDLGDEVKVQIYNPVGDEKRHVFIRDLTAKDIRNHSKSAFVAIHLDREVDHTEYITSGDERYCRIYLTPEEKDDQKDILPLDVFLKNLHPDTFAVCKLWYGDPNDDAGEFIELGMCGADYRPAYGKFKEFHFLIQEFKVVEIYVDANKQLRVNCVKKENITSQARHNRKLHSAYEDKYKDLIATLYPDPEDLEKIERGLEQLSKEKTKC